MGYTITLDMDEVSGFWHTGSASAQFREPRQYGRFEATEIPREDAGEASSIADRLIASPAFDDGALLWCETRVEALLLAKVHRAAGHTAHLLWDMAENPDGSLMGHVVLTSASL